MSQNISQTGPPEDVRWRLVKLEHKGKRKALLELLPLKQFPILTTNTRYSVEVQGPRPIEGVNDTMEIRGKLGDGKTTAYAGIRIENIQSTSSASKTTITAILSVTASTPTKAWTLLVNAQPVLKNIRLLKGPSEFIKRVWQAEMGRKNNSLTSDTLSFNPKFKRQCDTNTRLWQSLVKAILEWSGRPESQTTKTSARLAQAIQSDLNSNSHPLSPSFHSGIFSPTSSTFIASAIKEHQSDNLDTQVHFQSTSKDPLQPRNNLHKITCVQSVTKTPVTHQSILPRPIQGGSQKERALTTTSSSQQLQHTTTPRVTPPLAARLNVGLNPPPESNQTSALPPPSEERKRKRDPSTTVTNAQKRHRTIMPSSTPPLPTDMPNNSTIHTQSVPTSQVPDSLELFIQQLASFRHQLTSFRHRLAFFRCQLALFRSQLAFFKRQLASYSTLKTSSSTPALSTPLEASEHQNSPLEVIQAHYQPTSASPSQLWSNLHEAIAARTVDASQTAWSNPLTKETELTISNTQEYNQISSTIPMQLPTASIEECLGEDEMQDFLRSSAIDPSRLATSETEPNSPL